MNRLLATLALIPLLTTAARAQSTEDELRGLLADDLTAIGVNLPIWMASHLPAVMAPVGIGAGSGIDDDSGGFKLGIVTRLGLMNNLDDVAYGLKIMDLQPLVPSLMPWPQFGVVFGVGLGDGVEMGADIQFIPAMDIAAEGLSLKTFLLSGAATLRWRINKSEGAMPAVVLGIGGSFYAGSFEIGAGFENTYTETVDGKSVTGRVKIDTAPGVSWSLFQASPELRVAWDIGNVFRPFIGVGLGLTFGEVADKLSVKAESTIETVDGQPVDEDPVVYEDRVALFSTTPALWTLRPHVGFDLVLGTFAFTAQLDFAIMGKDRIDGNFSDGAGGFDPTDPNFLYNDAARSSQTQAALIATFAARLQF
jgi:opacity protein-like surface antigen